MTNKENIYLNNSELDLYNKIQIDINNTTNANNKELLKTNAFNILNIAMHRYFNNNKKVV